MAANLKAELSLKADKFDRTVIASQRQIKNMERGILSAGKSVVKFAAGFGAVAGAAEIFNKAISSNQTSADLLNNSIDTANRSVDAFFRSLITGDWNVFKNGVSSAIEEVSKLSQMLDNFGDKKLSFDFIKSQDLARIAEFETAARDTSLPEGERKKAVENMKTEIASLNKNTQDYIADLKALLSQKYKASFGININTEDIEYFFRKTNFGNKEALKGIEDFNNGLKKVREQYEYTTSANPYSAVGEKELRKGGEEAIELYKKQNSFLYAQSLLLEEGDKSRKETVDLLAEQYGLEREISLLEKRSNRTASGVNRLSANTGAAGQGITYQSGSLGKLDEEIKAFQTKLTSATDTATRTGIRQAISELQKEKHWIDLEATLGIGNLEALRASASSVSGNVTKQSAGGDIESGAISVNSDFEGAFQLVQSYNKEQQRAIELQNAWASGIGTTASGFQSLSTALSQVAGDNEAAARTAKAFMLVSQGLAAAQAIYEGVKTGYPALLFAIPSALAAVVSAFAVAGSFEDGGIVPGHSFSGDRLTARVNSGEMILNRAQQSRLFDVLSSGGAFASDAGSAEIKWKLKGSDIYGSLSNYNKKRSKF